MNERSLNKWVQFLLIILNTIGDYYHTFLVSSNEVVNINGKLVQVNNINKVEEDFVVDYW